MRPIRAKARRKSYAIADREKQNERSIRMLLSLAFLAPDIVNAAVEGRLPIGFGQSRLFNLPLGWDEQMSLLGLATK